MKKFNKGAKITLTVILGVLLVVGFLLCFVPMTVGANTFVSFSRSLKVSSDMTGAMYGEYDIIENTVTKQLPTESEIVSSMNKIKDVFDENGYKNVEVYAIGESKIRVEVSYPTESSSYATTYQLLSNVGTGMFSLRNEYSRTENSVEVFGYNSVSKVSVFANNGTNYLRIEFNDYGKEQYKALCEATSTIYIALGDYAQSISVSGVTDYSQFTLSDSDYANLFALEQRIKLGCLSVALDNNTTRINTISASLTAGESNSTPFDASFTSSTAFIVIMTSVIVIAVIGIAIFVIKFGYFALIALITFMFNTYLFLIIMNLIPSIEIGFSSIIALIIGIAVIYTYTYIYVSRIRTEYNAGKSLSASLETAYKKTYLQTLIGGLMLFVASLTTYFCAFGEIASVMIVFAITSFLSLFTNLLFVPFLIKLGISFGRLPNKLFRLKKHDMFAETLTVSEDEITVTEGDK